MLTRNQLLLLLFSLFFIAATPAYAVVKVVSPTQEEDLKSLKKEAKEDWKALSKKERKEKRKELKDAIKNFEEGDSTDTILLVIIAIVLPPLAMGIHDSGLTTRFWLSLLLTLLFYLPGLIYTLVIILGES